MHTNNKLQLPIINSNLPTNKLRTNIEAAQERQHAVEQAINQAAQEQLQNAYQQAANQAYQQHAAIQQEVASEAGASRPRQLLPDGSLAPEHFRGDTSRYELATHQSELKLGPAVYDQKRGQGSKKKTSSKSILVQCLYQDTLSSNMMCQATQERRLRDTRHQQIQTLPPYISLAHSVRIRNGILPPRHNSLHAMRHQGDPTKPSFHSHRVIKDRTRPEQ